MDIAATDLARELGTARRVPMIIPRGGATPLGSVGFVAAAAELHEQCSSVGLNEVTIVIPVGSGGSIAGLVAGVAAIGATWNIIGVSVSRPAETMAVDVRAKAHQTMSIIGIQPQPDAEGQFRLLDGRGEGFGVASAAEQRIAARATGASGLLVDATYNAKALRWLADNATEITGPVIYWHTGGALGALAQPTLTKDQLE